MGAQLTLPLLPHAITPMTVDDEAFVYESWMLSYRDSPHTRKWSDYDYFEYVRERVNKILARSTVLVARPVDWDEGILGWLCFEKQRPSTYYLHYAYTKTAYRQSGIASSLLRESEPTGNLLFTHLKLPGSNYLPDSFRFQKLHR